MSGFWTTEGPVWAGLLSEEQLAPSQWCEALSYFSPGGAQNASGRFQRESVFGHAICRNLEELQMANEAVKYYASEASDEF